MYIKYGRVIMIAWGSRVFYLCVPYHRQKQYQSYIYPFESVINPGNIIETAYDGYTPTDKLAPTILLADNAWV